MLLRYCRTSLSFFSSSCEVTHFLFSANLHHHRCRGYQLDHEEARKEGKANWNTMDDTMRRAMHEEGPTPGVITLTVARRLDASDSDSWGWLVETLWPACWPPFLETTVTGSTKSVWTTTAKTTRDRVLKTTPETTLPPFIDWQISWQKLEQDDNQ